MSEDNEPDRLAQLAKDSAALQRQMEPYIQGFEALRRQMEPYIRASEALRRQVEPIAQAAEQFVRHAGWPKISGPVLPYPLWMARAVDAGMRELLAPREPAVHHVTLTDHGAAVSTLAVADAAMASASAPMPQVRTPDK